MKPKKYLDFGKLAAAVGTPGIDPRLWSSHGVVATVDDSGSINYEDPDAVVVAPDGVWVDVVLLPTRAMATCRVQLGVGGRRCTINAPIFAGDEVLVVLPDGDANQPPVVSAILNSLHDKIPTGPDGKPVFKNDRLSIIATGFPIELRADQIILTDKNGDTQSGVLGDTLQDFLDSLRSAFSSHTHTYAGVDSNGDTYGGTTTGPTPSGPRQTGVRTSIVRVK